MGTTALTEAVFYILLSLDTPLHGYGIMQYQITPEGREAVRAELRRLHELTQNGDKLTSEWN
mgnify:CR=1 FL=1